MSRKHLPATITGLCIDAQTTFKMRFDPKRMTDECYKMIINIDEAESLSSVCLAMPDLPGSEIAVCHREGDTFHIHLHGEFYAKVSLRGKLTLQAKNPGFTIAGIEDWMHRWLPYWRNLVGFNDCANPFAGWSVQSLHLFSDFQNLPLTTEFMHAFSSRSLPTSKPLLGTDRHERIHFGSAESDTQIAMYDKTEELRKKQRKKVTDLTEHRWLLHDEYEPDRSVTRVECRLRRSALRFDANGREIDLTCPAALLERSNLEATWAYVTGKIRHTHGNAERVRDRTTSTIWAQVQAVSPESGQGMKLLPRPARLHEEQIDVALHDLQKSALKYLALQGKDSITVDGIAKVTAALHENLEDFDLEEQMRYAQRHRARNPIRSHKKL